MNRKNTSPDYGNWVPIAMMKGMAAVLLALLALTIVLAWLLPFPLPAVLTGILTAVLFLLWLYMLRCRALFDFSRGGLMGKLHQYLLDHLDWNGRGRLLEIGCGSGALLNRCAKRYPQANFTGIDYWGAEWSYAKEQCQKNAVLEGVSDRVNFQKGDAARLDFPDQTFDAVVSLSLIHI